MDCDSLAFWSSWASIISFFISLYSLYLVRSIRTNIIKFRRRQRLRDLLNDVKRIPEDAIPMADGSKAKLASLRANIPVGLLSRFYERGQIALRIHAHIDAENLPALKEAIDDWSSHSEDI